MTLRAKKPKNKHPVPKHEEVERAKKYTISGRKELKEKQRSKELSKGGEIGGRGEGAEKVDRRCS